jgi:hypothetical protein
MLSILSSVTGSLAGGGAAELGSWAGENEMGPGIGK